MTVGVENMVMMRSCMTLSVTTLILISLCHSCSAIVSVLDKRNRTLEEFADRVSDFGPTIPAHGVWGHVVFTEPGDACSPVKPPPPSPDNRTLWIAVIFRYPCNFYDKVLRAQQAGFGAVIVYNNNSDDLVTMHGGQYGITIPSTFVGETSGILLEQYDKRLDVTVVLWHAADISSLVYFIILGCIGGMGLLMGVCIVVINWACHRAKKRMSLLSKRKLKKLPIHRFKAGDPYETCAICLEEYVDGDKLRLLPCGHAFHCKCIDPWLTEKRNTCPLCKDVVGRRHDNDAASASADGIDADETEPLLLHVDDTQPSASVAAINRGFDTIADVHILTPPTTRRGNYGAVNLSLSPSATVVNEASGVERGELSVQRTMAADPPVDDAVIDVKSPANESGAVTV